jgi:hypothetical protein
MYSRSMKGLRVDISALRFRRRVYRYLLVDGNDLDILELEGITVDNTADTTWRHLASSRER